MTIPAVRHPLATCRWRPRDDGLPHEEEEMCHAPVLGDCRMVLAGVVPTGISYPIAVWRFGPLVHRPQPRGHHSHYAESKEWSLLHHEHEPAFINGNDCCWFDGAHCCTSRTPIHHGHLADNAARRNGFVNIVAVENLQIARLHHVHEAPGLAFFKQDFTRSQDDDLRLLIEQA